MSHAVQAFTSTINIAHVVCPVTRRKTVFEQYVASSSPLPACPAAQTWPSDNDVIDSVLLAAVAAAPSFARRLVVNHKSTTKPANLQYQKRRIESIYSGALKLVALYLVFNVSHSIELSTAGQLSKKDIQAELQFQSCYPFSYAMYAATTALLLALWIPRSKNHHQQDSDTKATSVDSFKVGEADDIAMMPLSAGRERAKHELVRSDNALWDEYSSIQKPKMQITICGETLSLSTPTEQLSSTSRQHPNRSELQNKKLSYDDFDWYKYSYAARARIFYLITNKSITSVELAHYQTEEEEEEAELVVITAMGEKTNDAIEGMPFTDSSLVLALEGAEGHETCADQSRVETRHTGQLTLNTLQEVYPEQNEREFDTAKVELTRVQIANFKDYGEELDCIFSLGTF